MLPMVREAQTMLGQIDFGNLESMRDNLVLPTQGKKGKKDKKSKK